MFILVVALAGGLLAGALLGGCFANLERLSLRLAWLVVVALLLQIVAFSPLGARLPHLAVIALHIASYGLLLACAAVNLRRPPLMCLGVGLLSNAVTIVANGGYMPASRAALRLAGLPISIQPHNNSVLAGSSTHFAFLGDIFALPHAVPLANIFSVGDILIAVGLAWLIAEAMRQPADETGLVEAQETAAELSPLILTCTQCGATFADRFRLRAHLLQHDGLAPAQWQPSIERKPRVVAVPAELSARPHVGDRRSA
jgi:hypothetical protein